MPEERNAYTEYAVKDTKKDVSTIITGLTPIDPKALEEFKREMNEEVIPDILRTVEERRVLAAESRLKQLKC